MLCHQLMVEPERFAFILAEVALLAVALDVPETAGALEVKASGSEARLNPPNWITRGSTLAS